VKRLGFKQSLEERKKKRAQRFFVLIPLPTACAGCGEFISALETREMERGNK